MFLIACASPSMQSSNGGRPGSVSSRYSISNMGQAISGSSAPRRARREREIFGGTGMGTSFWAGG